MSFVRRMWGAVRLAGGAGLALVALGAAGGLLGASTGSLGVAAFALTAVAIGVASAAFLVGRWDAGALGAGALGALLFTAALPVSPVLAVAVAAVGAYLPRALRGRAPVGIGVVLVGAAAAGGLAGAMVEAFAAHPPLVAAVALGMGTVVLAMPALWPVDDELAYRLRLLASRATGPLRIRILRGVALRRRMPEVDEVLADGTRRRVERAWLAFQRAAESRVRAPIASREALDRRLQAYLEALRRAILAAERADDLSTGLDDLVLAELRLEGDDLSARADALWEVCGAGAAGAKRAKRADEAA